MKIRNNKPLYYAVEHMLQGLSYWLGFRTECYAGHSVMEAVAVEIAVQILNAHIDHSMYKVKMEYGYDKVLKNNSKGRMDVAILDKSNNCVCAIEFKTSTDSNKGVTGDIAKLQALPSTIYRLVVLISQKETNITKQFVDDEGKALRSIPNIPNVKVIRATKAMETASNSKNSFKAICIEIH